jgi:hypothetical protein
MSGPRSLVTEKMRERSSSWDNHMGDDADRTRRICEDLESMLGGGTEYGGQ